MAFVTVKGMNCGHCQKAVTEAIAKVPGVSAVTVDLTSGKAEWQGSDSPETLKAVKEAVIAAGFAIA